MFRYVYTVKRRVYCLGTRILFRDVYIGDAIIRVNGEEVGEASHEEALVLLQVGNKKG